MKWFLLKLDAAKSLFHLFGAIIAIAGVFFVIQRFYVYFDDVNLSLLGIRFWFFIFLLALIYGAANILLAMSWRALLKFCGVDVSRLWSVVTYGISQIGKYVPGNLFHIVGRQAMGAAAGCSHRSLIVSTILEFSLISGAASFFAVLLLPMFQNKVTPLLSLILFFVAASSALILVRIILGVILCRAATYYFYFLAIMALMFLSVVSALMTKDFFTFDKIVIFASAYILAWLIGLVAPGAPAGIGVRELVLLGLLNQQLDASHLIMAVTLTRFVTTGGDFMFFIFASAMKKRYLPVA